MDQGLTWYRQTLRNYALPQAVIREVQDSAQECNTLTNRIFEALASQASITRTGAAHHKASNLPEALALYSVRTPGVQQKDAAPIWFVPIPDAGTICWLRNFYRLNPYM